MKKKKKKKKKKAKKYTACFFRSKSRSWQVFRRSGPAKT